MIKAEKPFNLVDNSSFHLKEDDLQMVSRFIQLSSSHGRQPSYLKYRNAGRFWQINWTNIYRAAAGNLSIRRPNVG